MVGVAAWVSAEASSNKQHWNKGWQQAVGPKARWELLKVPHPHVTGSNSVFSVTEEAEAAGPGVLGQVPQGRAGGHGHSTATLVHIATEQRD